MKKSNFDNIAASADSLRDMIHAAYKSDTISDKAGDSVDEALAAINRMIRKLSMEVDYKAVNNGNR
jgi:hypothetical protein